MYSTRQPNPASLLCHQVVPSLLYAPPSARSHSYYSALNSIYNDAFNAASYTSSAQNGVSNIISGVDNASNNLQ